MNEPRESGASTDVERNSALPAHGSGWDELVHQCAKGDQDALAALYDKASRLIYGVALRILARPEDAEEVAMDVFIQVWRTAARFDQSRCSAVSWLVLLTRSRAIDRIRSRAVRQRHEEPIEDDWTPAASGADPEESFRIGQLGTRVRNAMQALSAEQRHAIELAFFSGLTHVELARNLGLPLGTAKSRIRASMIKLRESLGEYA